MIIIRFSANIKHSKIPEKEEEKNGNQWMSKVVLKFHQKFTEKQISRAPKPKMAVSINNGSGNFYHNGQFVSEVYFLRATVQFDYLNFVFFSDNLPFFVLLSG